jgi:hypothetical protein
MLTPTLRRALILAIFLIVGLVNSTDLTVAQNLFEASGRITPSAGPADLFTSENRGAGLFSASVFPGIPDTGMGNRSIGQPQTSSTAVARDLTFGLPVWNRSSSGPPQPPSQLWIGTAQFGGFAAGSIAGTGRQQGGGFDQFARRGLSGPQVNFPSLFPGTGILQRNQFGGTVPGTPRFDARIVTSFALPSSSAAGTIRMSYRDMFSDERKTLGGNPGAGSGSAMFGTSNLGNGMFLSAGSSYGSRSTAGSASGNSPLAGQKHSGPSVGLRLTF